MPRGVFFRCADVDELGVGLPAKPVEEFAGGEVVVALAGAEHAGEEAGKKEEEALAGHMLKIR
jgi:hypothetical protein